MSFAASAAKCARHASHCRLTPHLHTQLQHEANIMTEFTETDLDPIPTEEDLEQLYGSKYLSAADIGDKKIRTRIAKIRKETLQQQGKGPRARFVIYFTTLDKGLVLNATNKITLVDGLGGTPSDWINAEIGLYAAPTQFAGKPTKGVRIKVLSTPKAAANKAAPKAPAPTAPAPKQAAKVAAAEEPMPRWDPEDPGFQDADFDEAAE
jgi:hypothetical protein